MGIEEFIGSIEEEFEGMQPGSIKEDTIFRNLEGWNSMLALIIIAKIDSTCNITITAEELANCDTIIELYSIVKSKLE